MKKINYLILFLWIFFSGCGNDIDSSPPLVFVTYPLDSSSVAEAILIGGSAVDNDSIKSVELWIDSLATGFFDSVAPYEFIWNTTSYLYSSLHYISLLAEDRSNNKNTSESVVVIVNNSCSTSTHAFAATYKIRFNIIVLIPKLSTSASEPRLHFIKC
jgi:hypothetical protein